MHARFRAASVGGSGDPAEPSLAQPLWEAPQSRHSIAPRSARPVIPFDRPSQAIRRRLAWRGVGRRLTSLSRSPEILMAMGSVASRLLSVYDPTLASRLGRARFLRSLAQRMTRPVMPDDEAFDYLPTQAVADSRVSTTVVPGLVHSPPRRLERREPRERYPGVEHRPNEARGRAGSSSADPCRGRPWATGGGGPPEAGARLDEEGIELRRPLATDRHATFPVRVADTARSIRGQAMAASPSWTGHRHRSTGMGPARRRTRVGLRPHRALTPNPRTSPVLLPHGQVESGCNPGLDQFMGRIDGVPRG